MPRIHCKEFPWYSPSDLKRREHAIEAAKLMLNAAQTAPVTGGVDHMESELVWGEQEQNEIAEKMDELSITLENKFSEELFYTEAQMVREADCILILGDIRGRNTPFDANCGFCGGPDGCGFVYSRRKTSMGQIDHRDKCLSKTLIDGPLCQIHVQNLGYSTASALWMAKTLLVDARPSYVTGMAAKKLGYCKASEFMVGVLIAATSKNPFVDVNYNYHVVNMHRMVDSVRKHYIISRQMGLDYRTLPSWKFFKKDKGEKEE